MLDGLFALLPDSLDFDVSTLTLVLLIVNVGLMLIPSETKRRLKASWDLFWPPWQDRSGNVPDSTPQASDGRRQTSGSQSIVESGQRNNGISSTDTGSKGPALDSTRGTEGAESVMARKSDKERMKDKMRLREEMRRKAQEDVQSMSGPENRRAARGIGEPHRKVTDDETEPRSKQEKAQPPAEARNRSESVSQMERSVPGEDGRSRGDSLEAQRRSAKTDMTGEEKELERRKMKARAIADAKGRADDNAVEERTAEELEPERRRRKALALADARSRSEDGHEQGVPAEENELNRDELKARPAADSRSQAAGGKKESAKGQPGKDSREVGTELLATGDPTTEVGKSKEQDGSTPAMRRPERSKKAEGESESAKSRQGSESGPVEK